MKIRAKTSFCGTLSMGVGEIREYSNADVISDLLDAGYIEILKPDETPSKEKREPDEMEGKEAKPRRKRGRENESQ